MKSKSSALLFLLSVVIISSSCTNYTTTTSKYSASPSSESAKSIDKTKLPKDCIPCPNPRLDKSKCPDKVTEFINSFSSEGEKKPEMWINECHACADPNVVCYTTGLNLGGMKFSLAPKKEANDSQKLLTQGKKANNTLKLPKNCKPCPTSRPTREACDLIGDIGRELVEGITSGGSRTGVVGSKCYACIKPENIGYCKIQ